MTVDAGNEENPSNETQIRFRGLSASPHFGHVPPGQQHAAIDVVACCEEDAETRAALAENGEVTVSHIDYSTMLAEVACDVVAVGDCYGPRAARLIAALAAGKHVISDKPV